MSQCEADADSDNNNDGVMIVMCNPATSSRRSVAQFGTWGKFLDNQLASSSVCNKNFRLGKFFDQLDSNILAHCSPPDHDDERGDEDDDGEDEDDSSDHLVDEGMIMMIMMMMMMMM